VTVETLNTTSGPYTGTGVAAQQFAVTFQSAGADEIEVLVNGAAVDPSLYTFTRNADGTGTVTALVGFSGTVHITSEPDFEQETDFQRYGPYFPDDLNAPLDRQMKIAQYLRSTIMRSIRVPATEPELGEIPTALSRASGVLGFDASGNLTVLPVGGFPAGPPGTLALSGHTIYTPENFGAVGDDVTDDYLALQQWLDAGGELILPKKQYRCSARLIVRRHVNVRGFGLGFTIFAPGLPAEPGSRIYFTNPANMGVIVYTQTTESDEALVNASPLTYFTQEGGRNSIFQGIAFIGPGAQNLADRSLTAMPGFETRTKITMRDCDIQLFNGNGLVVNAGGAEGVVDADADYGNASTSVFDNVAVQYCGLNGAHMRRRDANAIAISNCNFSNNGKWGMLDDGMLGNTYVNPHFATNNLNYADASSGGAFRASATAGIGSIKTTSTVGLHTILGLYIEPGQGGGTSLTSATQVLGGQGASIGFHTAGSIPLAIQGSNVSGSPLRHTTTAGAVEVYSTLGGDPSFAAASAFTFGSANDSNSAAYKLLLSGSWWHLNYISAYNVISYPTQIGTPPRRYAPWCPQGIGLGADGAGPLIYYGSVAAVVYARGDILWAAAPSASASMGQVCTTAGTGLSTAVFKAMPALAA
jgi:hypothetical protein